MITELLLLPDYPKLKGLRFPSSRPVIYGRNNSIQFVYDVYSLDILLILFNCLSYLNCGLYCYLVNILHCHITL